MRSVVRKKGRKRKKSSLIKRMLPRKQPSPIAEFPFFQEISRVISVNWGSLRKGLKAFEARDAETTIELLGNQFDVRAASSNIAGNSFSFCRSDGSQFVNKGKLFGALQKFINKPIDRMRRGEFIEFQGFIKVRGGQIFTNGHIRKDERGYTASLTLSPSRKVLGKPMPTGSNMANILFCEEHGDTVSVWTSVMKPKSQSLRVIDFLESVIDK